MIEDITGIIETILVTHGIKKVAFVLVTCTVMSISALGLIKTVAIYLNAPRPIITIRDPSEKSEVADAGILLQGTVTPADSVVKVNNHTALTNGDGSFSQVIDLKEGDNIIKVEAEYLSKKSAVMRKTKRVLSNKEIEARKVAQLKEQSALEQKAKLIAQAEQPVVTEPSPTSTPEEHSVLGVVTDNVSGGTEIIDEQKIKKGNSVIVTGRMQNKTGKTIKLVKVRAVFKDAFGTPVDTQEGAVTDASTSLAPEAIFPFTIPATKEDFAGYDINFTYEPVG
jgi:hypothetical protein